MYVVFKEMGEAGGKDHEGVCMLRLKGRGNFVRLEKLFGVNVMRLGRVCRSGENVRGWGMEGGPGLGDMRRLCEVGEGV